MKQAEVDKIRINPKPEIRKRINKALKGSFKTSKLQVDGAIYNNSHSIGGLVISEDGRHLLEFKISKLIK